MLRASALGVSGCGVTLGEVGVPATVVLFLPPGSQALGRCLQSLTGFVSVQPM